MEIKKVSKNIYEIPKEGKMNVPVIIYASEKILEDIKNDKTLEQAKNVAHLPGIINSSIALADAHQGYGFPIGGVAAFDLDSGVISPGGVGYDINCLTGDSKILTEFGQSIKIEDFGEYKSEIAVEQNGRKLKQIKFLTRLPTLNSNNKKIENKGIELFMHRKSKEIYEIETNSGLKIKATKDHPFLTDNAMTPVFDLEKNENLAVNLFEGIEDRKIIDKKQAITAKILGYMFGDGCL